ncbi:glycoside hydrolase family 38 C-terminal domain-containing protein [Pedobacter sandarakinus]|uniref:glycoside hydrolase family 38 C-terminal domain-containing protein n=1 Tax=Pedobacter sandarakinus TaxID=353156 RepID=UPI002245B913|nr:glycoside hydrolase family 38 C-terminal domain-containing protein [Pedobacter sandarakinus]MCX2574110.1 glycosyl hydrolase [Pedobacter sandarakinus]
MNRIKCIVLGIFCCTVQFAVHAQDKFFIDGYHGGYWGHYPTKYTGFIADKLDQYPFWRINLEIEPVTWDFAKQNDASNYVRFKEIVKDQSHKGRVEFVNPAYGQSYLYNVQGESVIRQFELGIKKIKSHFPEAEFKTYSSEEPCFTSALPGILKSFGFQYASLKNPNTCWGGYTRAFGGELVNWTGSDGSSLLTVPRYESEQLLEQSTWQTTAWNNSGTYINSARKQGIINPIGMCLQDAGWENGPWLGKPKDFQYMLWADYIANVADKNKVTTWNFNQEDLQVSLVWGAQILQQMAQQTRLAENKLVMDEKIFAIETAHNKGAFTSGNFDKAWENLLLAEHHDSWIVPYNIVNKEKKWNWAQQVNFWASESGRIADSISYVSRARNENRSTTIKIYNTVGQRRQELVRYKVASSIKNPTIINDKGARVNTQVSNADGSLLFIADVPSMGFASYKIKEGVAAVSKKASQQQVTQYQGKTKVSTTEYEVLFDPAKGGAIVQLLAKKVGNMEYINQKSERSFNEMRGYFYKDSLFYSSKDQPAKITVIEEGPICVKIQIDGKINIHPFRQLVTFVNGSALIDVQTDVDWQGNPGIGQNYAQQKGWDAKDYKKAFYNDSLKLQAVFPLTFQNQKVHKNAPFDVMESKLKNTYFNTWDSIKNNVILNWVDVNDGKDQRGMALFTDHTSSYNYDERGILGLTLQYSGMGLWWRNYEIKGASKFHYALLPHAQTWDAAAVWAKSVSWNEPLKVVASENAKLASFSLLETTDRALDISAVTSGDKCLNFRVFNSSRISKNAIIKVSMPYKKILSISLNGKVERSFDVRKNNDGSASFELPIQQFGIKTVRILM